MASYFRENKNLTVDRRSLDMILSDIVTGQRELYDQIIALSTRISTLESYCQKTFSDLYKQLDDKQSELFP